VRPFARDILSLEEWEDAVRLKWFAGFRSKAPRGTTARDDA